VLRYELRRKGYDYEQIGRDLGAHAAPSGPQRGGALQATPDQRHAWAHDHMEGLVSEYREPDGSYRTPMACRLLWGQA
jgi:hypothetical protein